MRSLRIRDPNKAPPEVTPVDVWLEANGPHQVNVWAGNPQGTKQVVARLQLGNFKGDVHLRLPVITKTMGELLGVSTVPSLEGYTERRHISVNKE